MEQLRTRETAIAYFNDLVKAVDFFLESYRAFKLFNSGDSRAAFARGLEGLMNWITSHRYLESLPNLIESETTTTRWCHKCGSPMTRFDDGEDSTLAYRCDTCNIGIIPDPNEGKQVIG